MDHVRTATSKVRFSAKERGRLLISPYQFRTDFGDGGTDSAGLRCVGHRCRPDRRDRSLRERRCPCGAERHWPLGGAAACRHGWERLEAAGSRWKPLGAAGSGWERPKVRVIPTPGHTRGHQSLAVRKSDGTVVLAGQAHDAASHFAADHLVRHASLHGAEQTLPHYPSWLDRLAGFDPRRVLFAHDCSVWEPPEPAR
ncbi:hypothetical protein GCM10009601_49200 [Streptomyces thermospinosisporus]|uniref:MBL fold metallo-hydrolase n=1 Tax=Streptomyces thermospinosisporus TaxID=161482 RepID=A0ABP4JWT4_9ACTN